jgi:hypothetical protein
VIRLTVADTSMAYALHGSMESVAQEYHAMLLRLEFHRYCEFIGRASAIVAFVSMTSLILAATAVDVWH